MEKHMNSATLGSSPTENEGFKQPKSTSSNHLQRCRRTAVSENLAPNLLTGYVDCELLIV